METSPFWSAGALPAIATKGTIALSHSGGGPGIEVLLVLFRGFLFSIVRHLLAQPKEKLPGKEYHLLGSKLRDYQFTIV